MGILNSIGKGLKGLVEMGMEKGSKIKEKTKKYESYSKQELMKALKTATGNDKLAIQYLLKEKHGNN